MGGTSSIGILDATNTTILRRQRVLETCFAAAQDSQHDAKASRNVSQGATMDALRLHLSE